MKIATVSPLFFAIGALAMAIKPLPNTSQLVSQAAASSAWDTICVQKLCERDHPGINFDPATCINIEAHHEECRHIMLRSRALGEDDRTKSIEQRNIIPDIVKDCLSMCFNIYARQCPYGQTQRPEKCGMWLFENLCQASCQPERPKYYEDGRDHGVGPGRDDAGI